MRAERATTARQVCGSLSPLLSSAQRLIFARVMFRIHSRVRPAFIRMNVGRHLASLVLPAVTAPLILRSLLRKTSLFPAQWDIFVDQVNTSQHRVLAVRMLQFKVFQHVCHARRGTPVSSPALASPPRVRKGTFAEQITHRRTHARSAHIMIAGAYGTRRNVRSVCREDFVPQVG